MDQNAPVSRNKCVSGLRQGVCVCMADSLWRELCHSHKGLFPQGGWSVPPKFFHGYIGHWRCSRRLHLDIFVFSFATNDLAFWQLFKALSITGDFASCECRVSAIGRPASDLTWEIGRDALFFLSLFICVRVQSVCERESE